MGVFVVGFMVFVLLVLVGFVRLGGVGVSGNVVFEVQHKFGVVGNESLSGYVAHDMYRHRRILSGVDLPIGGDSSPTSAALYYTKIQLGSPAKEFYVQVDTGSDILWVNCAGCENCPQKSDLGVPLSLYDPDQSLSSGTVTCDQDFCTTMVDPTNNECVLGSQCSYVVRYGDGSSTTGYFVRDNVQLNRISGDRQTSDMQGRIMFGCGSKQSGGLGKSQQALDGILGFGQSNASLISQLAASKKVKKMFSHCLSGSKGGIFAIGEVVHPEVNSTPILPDMTHFNIELKAIQVGDEFVTLPTKMFNTAAKRGTVIDSGTTLAYFPDPVYNQLMKKVTRILIFSRVTFPCKISLTVEYWTQVAASQSEADMQIVDNQFKCYPAHGNVDDVFPIVIFHFANALKLRVYPHQYIFTTQHPYWCIGFMSNGMQPRESNAVLLGDLLLTDRLVTYNMEDQTIGWTDYDCSSSIRVKDEESGMVYEVGAHDISWTRSGAGRSNVSVFVLLVFIIATKLVMYE
ncbi:putative nepenthesin [Helianthus annuus]|nr:putative nepenthesin [Helianthus annuus]